MKAMVAVTVVLLGVLLALGGVAVYLGLELDNAQGERDRFQEDLYHLRVQTATEDPETAQRAIAEYHAAMDYYERDGAENKRWARWEILEKYAFPLLDYITECAVTSVIPKSEATDAALRMERYLEAQPEPDPGSEQHLNGEIWARIGK